MDLKSKVRTIQDRPKPWIAFKDITSLIQDPEGLAEIAKRFFEHYKNSGVVAIAGIDARGFIFGAMLAQMLGIWFIPIRKKGKLPADVIRADYELEYWTATIEIHKDSIKKWQKIVLVDDLIATGGSCFAACELIEKLWSEVFEIATVIDLTFLGGSEKLTNAGYKVFSLIKY